MNNERPSKIDQLQYEEAWSRGINQSYSFYLTLGFFITIIGGYYIFNPPVTSLFTKAIGIIFLLLLVCQAKTIRLQSDNQKLLDMIKIGCNPKRFPSTGLKGVADACHCIILTSITAFFILKPLCFTSNIYSLLVVSGFLFVIIYYGLGSGNFLIYSFPKIRNIMHHNYFQYFAYFIIFFFLLFYGTYLFIERQYYVGIPLAILIFISILILILYSQYFYETEKWTKKWLCWYPDKILRRYYNRH